MDPGVPLRRGRDDAVVRREISQFQGLRTRPHRHPGAGRSRLRNDGKGVRRRL